MTFSSSPFTLLHLVVGIPLDSVSLITIRQGQNIASSSFFYFFFFFFLEKILIVDFFFLLIPADISDQAVHRGCVHPKLQAHHWCRLCRQGSELGLLHPGEPTVVVSDPCLVHSFICHPPVLKVSFTCNIAPFFFFFLMTGTLLDMSALGA